MPFKFRYLCTLLEALEDNRVKKRATCPTARNSDAPIIISWFQKHDRAIPRQGPAAIAFLSCLFPERRVDRVHCLQEKRLENIIGRSLQLGTTRLERLRSWRGPNGVDFAKTVQNVMSEAEFQRPSSEKEVTLEEIDLLFDRMAATIKASSPELRARIENPISASEALIPLFHRLQSLEGKWLVRMLLKQYTPVELPETLVMRQFHFLLPDILRLQKCLAAAVQCLEDPEISNLPARPQDRESERHIKLAAASHLRPAVGTMIQRAPHDKSRSLRHCCNMAGRKRIGVERKYDGEYCQIHIDLSKGKDAVRIFSKGGRDSTGDRIRLHAAIENALRIGKKDCPIKRQCILEGELLIWHQKEERILPFDAIRKNVSRGGRLYYDPDSPRDILEQPMVMLYDLLLLDSIICLNESHDTRRSRLESLVRVTQGECELGYRKKIAFASSGAKSLIRLTFAKSIKNGWEGLVLKPCEEPYFSLSSQTRFIKLKKDYITGLGDVADLAIVGGRRDAKDEEAYKSGTLTWTTFHLATLENADHVRRFSARPTFRVVGAVTVDKATIPPESVRFLNTHGQFERIPYTVKSSDLEVIIDQSCHPPTDLFRNPFVVEVLGSGFVKPANLKYHTLRFPRITKIHQDRPWHEILSFDGLQNLAAESLSLAKIDDSQEDCKWIQKLTDIEPRSRFVNQESQLTASVADTGSFSVISTPSAGLSRASSPMRPTGSKQLAVEARQQETNFHAPMIPLAQISTTLTQSTVPKRKREEEQYSPTATKNRKRPRLSDGSMVVQRKDKFEQPMSKPVQPDRSPLSEIRNPPGLFQQPSYTLPAQPRIANSSEHRDGLPQSQARRSWLENRLDIQVGSPHPRKPDVPYQEDRGGLPLPTPPVSSAEAARNDDIQKSPHKSPQKLTLVDSSSKQDDSRAALDRRKPAPAPPNRTLEEVKAAYLASMTPIFSSMTYLPSTFHTPPSPDSAEIFSSLAQDGSSFTFSRDIFWEHILAHVAQLHVVLVNKTKAAETGAEIGAWHRFLRSRAGDPGVQPGQKIRLVFLDWRAAKVVGEGTGASNVRGRLESGFGGCLEMKRLVKDVRNEAWEVRPVWKWDDVMMRDEIV